MQADGKQQKAAVKIQVYPAPSLFATGCGQCSLSDILYAVDWGGALCSTCINTGGIGGLSRGSSMAEPSPTIKRWRLPESKMPIGMPSPRRVGVQDEGI